MYVHTAVLMELRSAVVQSTHSLLFSPMHFEIVKDNTCILACATASGDRRLMLEVY